MNVNNWLCKHLDEDKKGYVNIADIVFKPFKLLFNFICFVFSEKIFPVLILGFVVFCTVGLTSAFLQGFITPEYPAGFKDVFVILLRGWIIPGTAIMMSAIIYKPMKYVLSLKVAKCPLNEKEELK